MWGKQKWNEDYVILAVIISPQFFFLFISCNRYKNSLFTLPLSLLLHSLSLTCTLALLLHLSHSDVFVEIQLRLYGSSCTKFGFKDADINIDILYPLHVSRATLSDPGVFVYDFWGGKSLSHDLLCDRYAQHIQTKFCVAFMSCKGFVMDVLTDAPARGLVAGPGEPLCEP